MEKRKVRLWGGVVWGTLLELWRGEAQSPEQPGFRPTVILRVAVTFDGQVALARRFDNNLTSLH